MAKVAGVLGEVEVAVGAKAVVVVAVEVTVAAALLCVSTQMPSRGRSSRAVGAWVVQKAVKCATWRQLARAAEAMAGIPVAREAPWE